VGAYISGGGRREKGEEINKIQPTVLKLDCLLIVSV
jgi:hypothetical protein